MDARASWQVAQSSMTAAAARGLLREAQRPLSTLNTFGSMLVPRLKDGEPDKDMAKGILMQVRRPPGGKQHQGRIVAACGLRGIAR